MRYARRRANVTPAGTSAIDRAVRHVTPAWRAYGTLLGLMFPAAFAFRFQVVTRRSRGEGGTMALNEGPGFTTT